MEKIVFIRVILINFLILLIGCESSNTNHVSKLSDLNDVTIEDENTPVNIIEQANPQILIVPSDHLLKKRDCISFTEISGKNVAIRDYEKFLISSKTDLDIIGVIQDKFIQMDYPLLDLSQSLKSINNKAAMDMASDYRKDAKTILLSTLRPDYYLEYEYSFSFDKNSLDLSRSLSCSLSILDAYTNKKIASIQSCQEVENKFGDAYETFLKSNIDKLALQLKEDFKRTISKGREVTIRICVNSGSNIDLSSENENGETLSDWIIDYMKINTKKGTYKLQTNTTNEIFFSQARIRTINEDGTQYNAYDWSRDFIKSLRNECGIKSSNESQGLGDIIINIKGLDKK